jgi:hypothetical protein
MKTVSYIKELQNKIKELEKESLKESKKRANYIKELENKIKELEKKYTSQTVLERDTDCTDSAPREPLMSYRSLTDLDTGLITYSSEMAHLTTVVATTHTGASESSRETSCTMDVTVPTTSEAEWVIASPEEEEEELPEFNTVEDLRQWLGLCSPMDETVQTTSEEEELPEFNSEEDLRQWVGQ